MHQVLKRAGLVFAAVLLILPMASCGCVTSRAPSAEPTVAAQPGAQPSSNAPAAPQPQPEAAAPQVEGTAGSVPQTSAEPKPEPPNAERPAVPSPPVEAAPSQTQRPAAPAPPPVVAEPPPAAKRPPATQQRTPGGTSAKPAQVTPQRTAPAQKAAPPAPPLDLNGLKQELKDTKAIGVFSKLTLKNQMDDLLDAIRKFHQGQGKRTLAELHRSYELLVMKVLSLVQGDDRKLASDIVASREAIWGILADPRKFAALQL